MITLTQSIYISIEFDKMISSFLENKNLTRDMRKNLQDLISFVQ